MPTSYVRIHLRIAPRSPDGRLLTSSENRITPGGIDVSGVPLSGSSLQPRLV